MRILYTLLLLTTFLFASDAETSYYDENDESSASCLILKDENSIICKYITPRIYEDKKVIFEWIDPNGDTTRQREISIPAGHGSAYDFRYIEGRVKGTWTFRVIDANKEYATIFEIK